MEWKLVLSTFSLIFLAELGDKTQLAAFAATAGARSPWSVFLGAASALVLSTLLAVLLGNTIQRVVPQQYLKLGAGILFVVFGALLIAASVRGREVVVAPAAASGGALTRLVLSTATAFEETTSADYESMAAAAKDPALRDLLTALTAEERGHLKALHDTIRTHGQMAWDSAALRPVGAMNPSVATINDATRKALDQAAAHEQATAAFYTELAKACSNRAEKAFFQFLSHIEREHQLSITDSLSYLRDPKSWMSQHERAGLDGAP